MTAFAKTLAISLILLGGVALAKPGVQDPTVKARMDLMGVNAMNAKILGDMAGGKTAFDAATAEAAKAALIAASAEIPAKFEPQATDPVSVAKPEIWTNWADFLVKADALTQAATAIDATSVDGLKAGMGAIGEACKVCHTTFRNS